MAEFYGLRTTRTKTWGLLEEQKLWDYWKNKFDPKNEMSALDQGWAFWSWSHSDEAKIASKDIKESLYAHI